MTVRKHLREWKPAGAEGVRHRSTLLQARHGAQWIRRAGEGDGACAAEKGQSWEKSRDHGVGEAEVSALGPRRRSSAWVGPEAFSLLPRCRDFSPDPALTSAGLSQGQGPRQ